MESRYKAFMLVAETLSMSKAAELAFVSHQCISGHIRNLEAEFNVQLFKRRPRLSLTPEGQTMLYSMQQLQLIESNLRIALDEASQSFRSKLCVGVPMARYSVLAPDILSRFKPLYPNVELDISGHYSSELEQLTLEGTLDFSIGIFGPEAARPQDLVVIPLMPESFLVLISDRMLQEYRPDAYPQCVERFHQGVGLEELVDIPLVQWPLTSRMGMALSHYANERNIRFNVVFESNRAETFETLSRMHIGATIVPSMMFPPIRRSNQFAPPDSVLHAFPLRINLLWETSLAYHKFCYMSAYRRDLIAIVRELFDGYKQIGDNL